MLSQPRALQHLCDAETIREIGKAYQQLVPGENEEALIKLLAVMLVTPLMSRRTASW